jgi:hypothetical protein
MSDKPFDGEACDIGGQASATKKILPAKNHIFVNLIYSRAKPIYGQLNLNNPRICTIYI